MQVSILLVVMVKMRLVCSGGKNCYYVDPFIAVRASWNVFRCTLRRLLYFVYTMAQSKDCTF